MATTLLDEQPTKTSKRLDRFLISGEISVKEAMRRMGLAGERILFVVDADRRILGSLSDGDIRRWVLAEGGLAVAVYDVCNKNPVCVDRGYTVEAVKELMLRNNIEWIPVVNREKKILKLLLWREVFGKLTTPSFTKIGIPVLIMAGGKGTRLDPLTRIMPKPLVPIGEKTIIETIMEKFYRCGVESFFMSINHKSRMIKAYFEELAPPYHVQFIEEKKPLGTAGSLKLLADRIEEELLVSNCDIIVETNYADIIEFHRDRGFDLTIVASFRNFTIPYGICAMHNGGQLRSLQEKPEYEFLVNTGMYIVEKRILHHIPSDKPFDMTDLVQVVTKKGKVGVYPLDAESWIDIGQWEEYHKSLKALHLE